MKLTVISGGRTTERTLADRLTDAVGPAFARYMQEEQIRRADARREAKRKTGRRVAVVNGKPVTVDATGREIAGPRSRRRELAREQLGMFGGKAVKP